MTDRENEAGILALKEMLPCESDWPDIEKACRQNLRDNPSIWRTSFSIQRTPHRYGPNYVEMGEGDHRARVFELLRRNGAYTAPTRTNDPSYTGKVETLWPFHDQIVRVVDRRGYRIYNVTLPVHIFFPGYVQFEVALKGRATCVGVSGRGAGNWSAPNRYGGPVLFENLLESLRAEKR